MSPPDFEKLIRDHDANAAVWFKRLHAEVVALRKEVRILRKVVAEGEQLEFPWFRLTTPRRRQVERVVEYLRDHKGNDAYTPRRAAFETFVPEPGAFPTPESLSRYCYEAKVASFV